MAEFNLELCASCVRALDSSVQRARGVMAREDRAMAAGRRIRSGSADRHDLHAIADWKAPRAAHHILNEKNTVQLIEKSLRTAANEAASTNAKIDALISLIGVNVPMASAILTCIFPESYTVIDVRALDALRSERRTIGKSLYLRYLEFCRATAAELGVELRQLDRALWKSGSIV